MSKHVIILRDKAVIYELQRANRRSISFQIRAEGLLVRAPKWVDKEYIEQALIQKSEWIQKKTSELAQRRAVLITKQTRWEEGGELLYLGQRYRFKFMPSRLVGSSSAKPIFTLNPSTLELELNLSPTHTKPEQLKALCKKWLMQQAHQCLGERLSYLSERSHCYPSGWRIAYAKTRWGSCSRHQKIMLNWRLIHFDEAIIDYVIAHELAHLKEMNHSPRFWAVLETILPGYQTSKERLRHFDTGLLPDFSRS